MTLIWDNYFRSVIDGGVVMKYYVWGHLLLFLRAVIVKSLRKFVLWRHFILVFLMNLWHNGNVGSWNHSQFTTDACFYWSWCVITFDPFVFFRLFRSWAQLQIKPCSLSLQEWLHFIFNFLIINFISYHLVDICLAYVKTIAHIIEISHRLIHKLFSNCR